MCKSLEKECNRPGGQEGDPLRAASPLPGVSAGPLETQGLPVRRCRVSGPRGWARARVTVARGRRWVRVAALRSSSFLGGTNASCLGGSFLSIRHGAARGRSPVSACSAHWH